MSKPMGHYRLASKALGDDCTRSRYVRTTPGHKPTERKRRRTKPRLPGFEAPFIQEGRTKFRKGVKQPGAMKNLLVSGHSNIKIGRDVRKGHLRGYWIYTLSLEERKTCPSSCLHWQSCYGNNMPFAKRIDHTSNEFLGKLDAEITKLCAQAKKRGSGILIRLHALGDFFSVPYVWFWRERLAQHPNLALYGYTARHASKMDGLPSFLNAIGNAIAKLNEDFGARSMIRFSDGKLGRMDTVSIGSKESRPANAFVCPEQTGSALGCDYCAACWSTDKTVAFLEH